MSRRLFSHNPGLGITKYWHYDDDTDTAVIESVAEHEGLLEAALRSRNDFTSLDRMGDGVQKVADVPMDIYSEWLRTGKDKDPAFVRKWLNDPENRRYRTRLMRV